EALELEARVVTDAPPDSVRLWLSTGGQGWFRPHWMQRAGPYRYALTIPAAEVRPGPHRYMVSVHEGDEVTTFPGGVSGSPGDWDFGQGEAWSILAVSPTTPLPLLKPSEDVDRLSFSRIGDGWRQGIFRIVPSSRTGEPAFRLELPVNVDGITPEDYRASLVVKDRIEARGEAMSNATALRVQLRGVGPGQRAHVTLVERDGTGWSAPVEAGPEWAEVVIPLAAFEPERAANLPMGFPGHWNYWLEPPAGRGGPGDRVRPDAIERVQLSLRRADAHDPDPGEYGVEVESITVIFESTR
ncbi:MAG: hypothetical protein ACLFRX_03695, partial [Gemmatimonadota bacterium]